MSLTPEERDIVIRLRLQNADEAHVDAISLLDRGSLTPPEVEIESQRSLLYFLKRTR